MFSFVQNNDEMSTENIPGVIERFSTGSLTGQQYFGAMAFALSELGWEMMIVSKYGFFASPMPGLAFVGIVIKNKKVAIISHHPDALRSNDGLAQDNIHLLLEKLDHVFSQKLPHELDEVAIHLQKKVTEKDNALFEAQYSDMLETEMASPLDKMKPKAGNLVTPVIVGLNVLIFVLMAFSGINPLSPDGAKVVEWGSNFSPNTLNGEWWRLFTCVFIHFGILHLAFNMMAIFNVGQIIEKILGAPKYVLAYLVAGFTGSVVSIWWNGITNSAGASGAIFGMFGLFAVLLFSKDVSPENRKKSLPGLLGLIGFNLLLGTHEGIDNAGHVGGLLGGVLMGLSFLVGSKEHKQKGLLLPILMAVLVTGFTTAKFLSLPNFHEAASNIERHFSEMQKGAVKINGLMEDKKKLKSLIELQLYVEIDSALVEIKNVNDHILSPNKKVFEEMDEQLLFLRTTFQDLHKFAETNNVLYLEKYNANMKTFNARKEDVLEQN